MRFRPLLAFLLLLGATACSDPTSTCATLIGGGAFCLQPTTALAEFEVQQKVEMRLGDHHDTLIVSLEVDAAGLRLVGLTPFGQKAAQLEYDNHAVTAKALPNARISPALLVALLQIALWPADSVRAGLGAPLTLAEGHKQRQILHRSESILLIDYSGEQPLYRQIHISVPSIDLELTIDTLEAVPAAKMFE